MKKNLSVSISLLIFCLMILSSCKNAGDARKISPDPRERVKQNIEEGRGFRLKGFTDQNKSGEFDFASSNELWRASLDTLEFMPLALANYSGGIIVTDWYSEGADNNESIKISIRFLSNEIRSDAIDVDIFYKKCVTPSNCSINKQDGQLRKEITKQILAKATIFKKQSKDKNFQPYQMTTPGD
mgnify:CR=1 FL=1